MHADEVLCANVHPKSIELTIVAKNDYCDSIDTAGSAIVILLLLWTTIAILL